jgi:DNA-binding response OmpR family regulator
MDRAGAQQGLLQTVHGVGYRLCLEDEPPLTES